MTKGDLQRLIESQIYELRLVRVRIEEAERSTRSAATRAVYQRICTDLDSVIAALAVQTRNPSRGFLLRVAVFGIGVLASGALGVVEGASSGASQSLTQSAISDEDGGMSEEFVRDLVEILTDLVGECEREDDVVVSAGSVVPEASMNSGDGRVQSRAARSSTRPRPIEVERRVVKVEREQVLTPYRHVNSRGETFYLNTKMVGLRGGKQQRIYYFSRDERAEGASLPDGYAISENPRNGFLQVRSDKKH